MIYSELKKLIYIRGYKLEAIAKGLGISSKSLRNKIKGVSDFWWPEVCILQKEFFPDISKDEIMKR